MEDQDKVCGTCIYNVFDGDCNEFVCDNEQSDCYGCMTMYPDTCDGWEEK